MPDFDIDFCLDGRDRVIDYVKRQVRRATASRRSSPSARWRRRPSCATSAACSACSYGFADGIAKLIPFELGKRSRSTMRCGREGAGAAPSASKTEDEVRELIELAESLEGLARNAGTHAGGVVIAPGGSRISPALHAAGSRRHRHAVRQGRRRGGRPGQVRLPGPATLTIIDWAVRHRPSARRGRAATRRSTRCRWTTRRPTTLLRRGETDGGVPARIARHAGPDQRLQPDRFEDIVALVALFRPGPLESGMVTTSSPASTARERRRLPAPAPRAGARADLRRDPVPGAGHADRAGARRLHARRRRPAAPRDGQEEARGDGEAARRSSSTAPTSDGVGGRRRRTSST